MLDSLYIYTYHSIMNMILALAAVVLLVVELVVVTGSQGRLSRV